LIAITVKDSAIEYQLHSLRSDFREDHVNIGEFRQVFCTEEMADLIRPMGKDACIDDE